MWGRPLVSPLCASFRRPARRFFPGFLFLVIHTFSAAFLVSICRAHSAFSASPPSRNPAGFHTRPLSEQDPTRVAVLLSIFFAKQHYHFFDSGAPDHASRSTAGVSAPRLFSSRHFSPDVRTGIPQSLLAGCHMFTTLTSCSPRNISRAESSSQRTPPGVHRPRSHVGRLRSRDV